MMRSVLRVCLCAALVVVVGRAGFDVGVEAAGSRSRVWCMSRAEKQAEDPSRELPLAQQKTRFTASMGVPPIAYAGSMVHRASPS